MGKILDFKKLQKSSAKRIHGAGKSGSGPYGHGWLRSMKWIILAMATGGSIIGLLLYIPSIDSEGLRKSAEPILFFLLAVLGVFVAHFWMLLKGTCPKCKSSWSWKTVDVSDTPLGHTSALESFDKNAGYVDKSPDVRYYTTIIEYGRRRTLKKCSKCGHSEVTVENYKKDF